MFVYSEIQRKYLVVFDLIGVLVHRGEYVKGSPRIITLWPGCKDLINWVEQRATIAFWSSVVEKNMVEIVKELLKGGTNILKDVNLLTQTNCHKSPHI